MQRHQESIATEGGVKRGDSNDVIAQASAEWQLRPWRGSVFETVKVK